MFQAKQLESKSLKCYVKLRDALGVWQKEIYGTIVEWFQNKVLQAFFLLMLPIGMTGLGLFMEEALIFTQNKFEKNPQQT